MTWESFYFIPERPGLSIALLVLAAVVVFYLARVYAHRFIYSLTHSIHYALRLASRSIITGEQQLQSRNREVLLSSGAEAMEKRMEREFHRINNVVAKDLQAYPSMHRSISDLINSIDEDYRRSTETPPSPPGWVNAVEAVSNIPSSGDTMVAGILADIEKTVEKHHKEAMGEYRKASINRHGLLKKMAPDWRKMSNTLESTDKTIKGILERSSNIDKKMDQYEEILSKTDNAERMLSSSAFTQFFIATFFMIVALGGVIVNFNLIALPLSEMVGAGSYIGPYKLNHFVALFIVLLEGVCGVFLMEALHITHLFPIIGNLEDRKRRKFVWVSLIMLLVFACVEASLAFMRDIIATKNLALLDTLAGVEAQDMELSWIPMVGQMVLGFMLPFVLAFVAIPFESFVHSSRTVLGAVVAFLMRLTAFLLRLIGNIIMYLGNLMVKAYDLLAFPLLALESFIKGRTNKGEQKTTNHGEVK